MLIRFTTKEQVLADQLSEMGFELVDIMQRKTQPFLFFEKANPDDEENPIRIQVLRSQLSAELIEELSIKYAKIEKTGEKVEEVEEKPAKKTRSSKKRRAKRKAKKDLTKEEESSTMDSKTEDSLDGVNITPEESKAIDKLYLETHWSKPEE